MLQMAYTWRMIEVRLEKVHTILLVDGFFKKYSNDDRNIMARLCPNAEILIGRSEKTIEVIKAKLLARSRYLKCNKEFMAQASRYYL